MSDLSKNVGEFNKAVTKGNSVKDDMMMTKQADLMEMKRALVVTPLCLSAMGQLCLIAASAPDIALNKTEGEGEDYTMKKYEYLKTPQSYRVSLMQVVQAAYWAFMQSHTSMQKIQLECGMVAGHLKDGLKLLFMGTPKDVEQFLPNNLRRISDIAQDCSVESTKVVDAYKNVMHIIQELQRASLLKTGDTERVEKMTKADKEQSELEKKMWEDEKEATAVRLKKLNKEVEENGKLLKEALDTMPTAGQLIGAAFTDAAVGLIKSVPGLVMAGMSARSGMNVSGAGGAAAGVPGGLNKGQEGNNNFEIVRNIQKKQEASQNIVVQLNILTGTIIRMQSFFNEDGTLNAKEIENNVGSMKKKLGDIKSEVASNGANAELSKAVMKYIDDLLQICNNFAKTVDADDPKAASELIAQFKDVQTKIANQSSASAGLTQDMPFNKEGPTMRNLSESNDDSTGKELVKSATIKLDTARGQLDKARERADKAFERDMAVGRKIHENIQKLAKFDATIESTKKILEILQIGLQTLDEIQKNWSKLLRYFETIKILLEVALGKPLTQFVEDGKVMGDNRMSGEILSKIQREIIYKPAYEASAVSYMVELLAGTYVKISQVHLMPLLDKVNGLFSLIGPENAQKVMQKKVEIENEGREAVQAIEKIIEDNKKKYEDSIKARKKVLEDAFTKYIPELPEAEKAEVKEVIESIKELDLTNEDLDEYV